MFKFVQEGYALDYTPAADTPAGTVVDYLGNGKVLGVTKVDIPAGILGAVDVGAAAGVYEADKEAGAIAKGDLLYTDGQSVANASSGTFAMKFGYALADAEADARTALVLKLASQA